MLLHLLAAAGPVSPKAVDSSVWLELARTVPWGLLVLFGMGWLARQFRAITEGFLGFVVEADKSRKADTERMHTILDANNRALGQSSAALVSSAEAGHRIASALRSVDRRRRGERRRRIAAQKSADGTAGSE